MPLEERRGSARHLAGNAAWDCPYPNITAADIGKGKANLRAGARASLIRMCQDREDGIIYTTFLDVFSWQNFPTF